MGLLKNLDYLNNRTTARATSKMAKEMQAILDQPR